MATTEWARELTTRSGFVFNVRPAQASDETALARFFAQVTPDDLRFRFLSGISHVSHESLVAMTAVDHRQTENFLAFVDGGAEIIATAMLACDAAMDTGEVAIVILPGFKGKGVSWDMLKLVAAYAEAKGVRILQSIESRQNHAAIDMEREMGFVATAYPHDPTLVLLQRTLTSAA